MAGTPISHALAAPEGGDGDAIRAALAAIDRVHLDGALPRIVVQRSRLSLGMQGGYSPKPPYRLLVGSNALFPEFSFVHEVGHLLDHHGLGNGVAFASEGDGRLDAWRKAVRESWACAVVRALAKSASLPPDVTTSYADYVAQDPELWARCYQQFVATRSGDPLLSNALNSYRLRPGGGKLYIPTYWDDADFAAIAAAIEDLFRELGWIA